MNEKEKVEAKVRVEKWKKDFLKKWDGKDHKVQFQQRKMQSPVSIVWFCSFVVEELNRCAVDLSKFPFFAQITNPST